MTRLVLRAAALAALAGLRPAGQAQVLLRLDFEAAADTLPAGWMRNQFLDGAPTGLDSVGAYEGRKSLVVRQPTPGRHATLFHVAPAPDLGGATHLRLRAWIRTELQSGTPARGWP